MIVGVSGDVNAVSAVVGTRFRGSTLLYLLLLSSSPAGLDAGVLSEKVDSWLVVLGSHMMSRPSVSI
jgi:hypothetical protein